MKGVLVFSRWHPFSSTNQFSQWCVFEEAKKQGLTELIERINLYLIGRKNESIERTNGNTFCVKPLMMPYPIKFFHGQIRWDLFSLRKDG